MNLFSGLWTVTRRNPINLKTIGVPIAYFVNRGLADDYVHRLAADPLNPSFEFEVGVVA